MQILEGAIVTGKSGKPLKVIGVNDDVLVVGSGAEVFKVKRSAVVQVISSPLLPEPPPQPGQIYEYIGNDANKQKQCGGIPLKLRPETDTSMGTKYCFEKPDGYLTTWLKLSEVKRLD